jgi:hypothetical protein
LCLVSTAVMWLARGVEGCVSGRSSEVPLRASPVRPAPARPL